MMDTQPESPFKDIFYFMSISSGYLLYQLSQSDFEIAQKKGHINQKVMEYLIFTEATNSRFVSKKNIKDLMFISSEFLYKEQLPNPIRKQYIIVPYLKNNNDWSLFVYDSVFIDSSEYNCQKIIKTDLNKAELTKNEIIIIHKSNNSNVVTKTCLEIPKSENSANACMSFIKGLMTSSKGQDYYIKNHLGKTVYSRKNIKNLEIDGVFINTQAIDNREYSKQRSNDTMPQKTDWNKTMKMSLSSNSLNSFDKTLIGSQAFNSLKTNLSIDKRTSSKPSSTIEILSSYGDDTNCMDSFNQTTSSINRNSNIDIDNRPSKNKDYTALNRLMIFSSHQKGRDLIRKYSDSENNKSFEKRISEYSDKLSPISNLNHDNKRKETFENNTIRRKLFLDDKNNNSKISAKKYEIPVSNPKLNQEALLSPQKIIKSEPGKNQIKKSILDPHQPLDKEQECLDKSQEQKVAENIAFNSPQKYDTNTLNTKASGLNVNASLNLNENFKKSSIYNHDSYKSKEDDQIEIKLTKNNIYKTTVKEVKKYKVRNTRFNKEKMNYLRPLREEEELMRATLLKYFKDNRRTSSKIEEKIEKEKKEEKAVNKPEDIKQSNNKHGSENKNPQSTCRIV